MTALVYSLCPPSLPIDSFPLAMGRQLISAEFFKQQSWTLFVAQCHSNTARSASGATAARAFP